MAIGCELEEVCRYSPCHIIEICKFRDMDLGNLLKKKVPSQIIHKRRKSGRTIGLALTTSQEDLIKARQMLKDLIAQNKLGENQLKALKEIKGIHYGSLTDPQKEQILSILQDVLKGEKH